LTSTLSACQGSGGRPKTLAEVRELARTHTVEAIETLAQIMRDPNENARARVAAASAILDRGWGKPEQAVALDARHQWSGEEIVVVTRASGTN
jgi:HEAT repeat protein